MLNYQMVYQLNTMLIGGFKHEFYFP